MNKSEQLYCELKGQLVARAPGSTFRTVRSIMDDFDVSQATVSSAIQRLTEEGLLRKNGRRSMEVTDAVLRYRKGAKPVYCLAIPRWPSEYYNMVELCFMEQAERLGYELEIVHYDWKLRVPRELELPKLDGLVVITGVSDITGDDVSFLDALDVPYVIFGRFLPVLALHSVSNDEEYTGAVAAHHLFELGHRKLAVLHSEPEGEGMTARTKGFRQFAELHGCSVEVIECGVRAGDDAVRKSYEFMKKRFSEKVPEFSALFVLSDSTAFGVYQACHECGIAIPGQLGVVTCGEAWNLAYRAPALTSVGIDHARLVEEAVRILKKNVPGKFEHVQVKAELTVRASTAPVAS